LRDKTISKEYKSITQNILEKYYLQNTAKQISADESNKLQELLKSDEILCRQYGIIFFMYARIPDLPRILENSFESEKDHTNRHAIIYALSKSGDKQTLLFLEQIQSNKNFNTSLRRAARIAITNIENRIK
jgi:hypothetical protein